MRIPISLGQIPKDEDFAMVSRWHVEDGQLVKTGEPLVDVEIGKATVEITAPVDGVLEMARDEGEEFPVSEAIGYVEPGSGRHAT